MSENLEIIEEPLSQLAECSEIPIQFQVRSEFQIDSDDPRSAVLTEVPVDHAWIKDYDAIEGGGASLLGRAMECRELGLLGAYFGGRRVAACVLAHNTDGVNALEGRSDVALIWNLRVHPDGRRGGIGRRLFAEAVVWARARGCNELRVETQNVNVPACRFYQRQGCWLVSIERHAYESFPQEIKLVWSLTL